MKYLSVFIFSILFLMTSCKVEEGKTDDQVKAPEPTSPQTQVESDFDTKSYFENISTVDNCLGEDEAFDELGKRLDEVIKAPLEKLTTASGLKNLYYNSHELQAKAPPRTNGRCADTFIAVKQRSLQKIGTMATPEAADALIELYKDSQFSFLGSEGRSLTEAMINCGSSIIPLLEPIKDQRPKISSKVLQRLKG